MNENYFSISQTGMSAQLKELSLDEMVEYVRNHIHNFLFDEPVCLCFIERFANDPEINKKKSHRDTLLYLLDKALQMRPFRPGLLKAVAQLTGNPQVQQRLDFVEKHNREQEIFDQISALDLNQDGEDAKTFITQLIQGCTDHVAAAQFALNVDRHLGIARGEWQNFFTCPPALRRDWEIHLFNHHAALCDYERAIELWQGLRSDLLREISLNLAAEMFVAAGDTAQAIDLYKTSLKQDPRQTPIRLRLRELENPFVPDNSLPDTCNVDICLYSWNKGDIFGQTLKSLSESDIGKARIHILLNGCTDNSREIVEDALPLFPDNEVVVHDLHVNIGAPAARNWLLRLPEVQESKYVAFLDDDVTVQKDWLARFLTITESDDQIGVVGCKILHPGEPAQIQHLFRYVAIAGHGLLKMSIHTPLETYDNHVYDFTRETRSVMGCLHLIRNEAAQKIPAGFDIRFSPSQVDDIDHDLAICLEGYKVMYCGTVTCIHHQLSGINFKEQKSSTASTGSIMGNDIKFYFKHADHLERLREFDNLSLDIGVEPPVI